MTGFRWRSRPIQPDYFVSGTGIPSEAGILPEVVKRYAAENQSGICLGEQAIGECFGAELENLPEVFHGICTPVRVIAEEKMFSGLGESFDVGRYHSWVVSRKNLPSMSYSYR